MPRDEQSPFTPHGPPARHVYRARPVLEGEVRRLSRGVLTSGGLRIGFLRGEPGIGKTSFAREFRSVAVQDGFCACECRLSAASSVNEFGERVLAAIGAAGCSRRRYRITHALVRAGRSISHLTAGGLGVRFDQTHAEDRTHPPEVFLGKLRYAIGEKPAFVVCDDIESLSQTDGFAGWLKSVNDSEMARTAPLFLLLIGTAETYSTLKDAHGSFARAVPALDVEPLLDEDVMDLFKSALRHNKIDFGDDAIVELASCSGGIPALAHILGDQAFLCDTDMHIGLDDAVNGVHRAAGIIKERFLPKNPDLFALLEDADVINAFARAMYGEVRLV